MAVITIAIATASITLLYNTALGVQQERLIETVESQAKLIEAVARFDKMHSHDTSLGESFDATLSQIREAHKNFKGFGETGEFTLAKLVGNEITFLLNHRHHNIQERGPLTLDEADAEPMRRALEGKSGIMQGRDYRGERVLAAYACVKELSVGIVAKIDMSEVQAPFIKTGLTVAGFAACLILIGSWLFASKITWPMIKKLEKSKSVISSILESAGEAIISIDESQRIRLFNKGAEEIFGFRQNEAIGQPLEMLLTPECSANHHGKVANFGSASTRARYMATRGEVWGQRKDGSTFPAEASISKFELNGKRTYTAVLRDISERKKAEKDLEHSFVESIYTLMRAAEYRDDETGAHVKRICYYTKLLAEKLGQSDEFCDLIFYASAMHDIGKIGTPDHILLKPGGFTSEEWEVMKTHAAVGAQIMSGNSSPYLQMGEQIALAHHERWDGSGYPFGLKGEAIPLPARIMQLADIYDALRSKRPYKEAFDHAQTIEIITKGDGRTEPSHFDPAVLAAFMSCADSMNEIFEERRGFEG